MSFFPQGAFYGIGLMSKSLEAFQYAENVTSDNIANVNTPGASQQQVVLTEAAPIVGSPGFPTNVGGTSGDGVVVAQVQRIHSDSYDALFRGASSSQNYFQTEQNTLNAVQSGLGEPNAGVSTAYNAFQSAINALAAQSTTGQSTALSANVLQSAQTLASTLGQAATTISDQESQVLAQGTTMVQTVNGILDRIASLNGQIRASTAAGDSPNTYADQRDQLIDQLSQYISTQTSVQADGSTLVSVNGQALVNDTVAYHLGTPVIGTATNGAPDFQVQFASSTSTSSSTAIPLGSGQLAALADLYNNKLTVYGRSLDQFASALSSQVNAITQAAYTPGGQTGSALFQPIVASLPITAANIKAGITAPSQLPTVLASTLAGNLVQPLNSSNNTVDSSAQLDGNASLANPPAGPLTGTLTVQAGGVTSTFNYSTAAGGNADSIDQFVTSFNAGQYGVSASYDPNSQQIVFTRDPTNGGTYSGGGSPDFTITDSNYNAATPNTSLLGALNAGGINGVDQNASNAFGASGEGAANALVGLFSADVGVPALATTSGAGVSAAAGVPVTVALPNTSFYSNDVSVGQVLTIDKQPGGVSPQENVTVTAVSYANGVESVTFTPANNHAANFSIASAATQTLGQFYGSLVTQVGLDAQTAQTGTTTQTSLANNINAVRQGISGINLDEQTQNLIEYQKAYTAAAQTINVMNQILQTTISSLGVGT